MDSLLVEHPAPAHPACPWGKGITPAPTTGTSPWGISPSNLPVSLQDVMSEELAKEIQREEEDKRVHVELREEIEIVNPEADLSEFLTSDAHETSDDLLLAQMLQHQFDKEHDDMLKIEEEKYNGKSKVSISFSNYRTIHPYHDDDDDSSGSDEPSERSDKDPIFNFGKSGILGKGKDAVSKHDAQICGRRNASRVMDFPPEFYSGDIRGEGVELPNKVYNRLKRHSQAEEKRAARLHEKKDNSTADQAVDPRTRLIMYKLVNADVLEDINGVISTGKEAVVFHANGGSDDNTMNVKMPREVAIKVFKTTLNEFHTRSKYVNGDYRFSKDEFKKQNPRKIIRLWAEKETVNLRRLKRAGLNCPEPLLLKKHVLVMSFIGENQKAAPKLKNVDFSTEDWEDAYDQTKEILLKLHNECHLVHADFSEYNLLWHHGKVFIIDVSQAVDLNHPHSLEFLLRDCRNVSEFFTKKGVHNVPTTYELFNEVTGLELRGEDDEFLMQVQQYENSEEWLSNDRARREYAFDYFFDKSTKERNDFKTKQQEWDPDFVDIDNI
ncbi:serine/threonine-protein kinase RIO3-like [Lineus longissimus]|uniref:serine/threonine-protein kinase RIO3-like n=1 Tax=Lineus longissimus TaxID=88925 RepID=UPI002B4F9F06